jgi:ferredoxin
MSAISVHGKAVREHLGACRAVNACGVCLQSVLKGTEPININANICEPKSG